jgi:hypothetical protein
MVGPQEGIVKNDLICHVIVGVVMFLDRGYLQHAKYEFATLNTCSIASIVAMDFL